MLTPCGVDTVAQIDAPKDGEDVDGSFRLPSDVGDAGGDSTATGASSEHAMEWAVATDDDPSPRDRRRRDSARYEVE